MTPPSVRVELELGPLLAPLQGEPGAELARRVGAGLTLLMEELGVPGAARVAVTGAAHTRPLRVRVEGEVQPYSPQLMARAWLAVAGPDLAMAPATPARLGGTGFPSAWLAGVVGGRGPGDARWNVVADWIEGLVTQVVLKRPSCLLGPEGLRSYAEEQGLPEGEVGPLLRGLLDLGVAVRKRRLICECLREGTQLGRPLPDTIEAAFAALRPHQVEIHVAPRTLAKLLPDSDVERGVSVYDPTISEVIRDLFADLEASFASTFGLVLPDLVWRASPGLEEGTMAVAIGPWRGLPAPLITGSEALANAPPGVVGKGVIHPAIHPQTGAVCSVIENDEEARKRLEREDVATWGPVDFVILNVLAELVRRQSRLLGLEEVEYALAHVLDETRDDVEANPVVWAVLERFSLGDLTRIFRAMLDERLSVAHLRTLLEHVAQFETVSISDPWLEVVDDRLPVVNDVAADAWQLVYAYLRRQLKPYLSREYIWFDHTVLAYALSHETEERLLNGPSVTDGEAEALRDAMWTELGQLTPSPFGQVLLANSAVRARVRALLAPELPDLAVVAPSELDPDVVIQPLATVEPHWKAMADAA